MKYLYLFITYYTLIHSHAYTHSHTLSHTHSHTLSHTGDWEQTRADETSCCTVFRSGCFVLIMHIYLTLIHTYTHTHTYTYIYTYTLHIHIHIYIHASVLTPFVYSLSTARILLILSICYSGTSSTRAPVEWIILCCCQRDKIILCFCQKDEIMLCCCQRDISQSIVLCV